CSMVGQWAELSPKSFSISHHTRAVSRLLYLTPPCLIGARRLPFRQRSVICQMSLRTSLNSSRRDGLASILIGLTSLSRHKATYRSCFFMVPVTQQRPFQSVMHLPKLILTLSPIFA